MRLLTFIRELFDLAKPGQRYFYIVGGLTLAEVLALLPAPLLFAWLISCLLDDVTATQIAIFVGCVLSLEIVAAGMRIARVRIGRRFALDAANRLRDRFFDHLLHLPYAHYLNVQAGGQANSYLNDIDDIDKSVTGVVEQGLRSTASLLLFGLTLIIWNPLIGGTCLIILPLTIYLQRRLRNRVRSSSRSKVDLREQMVALVGESVASTNVVKSAVLEQRHADRFAAVSADYRDVEVVMETQQASLRSSAAILLIFTQYGFFIFGAWLVLQDQLGLDAFLGQIMLIARLTGPMNTLLEYGNDLARSQAALHRVRSVLDLPREPDGKEELPDGTGGLPVAVEGLHFRFDPDIPLIDDWHFDIPAGGTLAIVGPSGCGKTSFLHLLLGLHNDYRGTLRIGGVDVQNCKRHSLRQGLGVVFQEQQLFNATIRENLSIARDAEISEAVMRDALDKAQALEFVDDLPDGLDTKIGIDGIKLSGGQRQRLAIAQAILKNPPVLLLDEATSALDSFSEIHIQRALKELFKSRTSIVIAHRLSTIVDADRIVVIDGGRVLAVGTHTALLAEDGIYRRLYDAQVTGFLDWDRLREEDQT